MSAKLLSEISHCLSLAKSALPVEADKPFGAVNVIFTGNFSQMKPVTEHPLFGHRVVQHLSANMTETVMGQTVLHGAYLCRLVNMVVILRKNWRALSDPEFITLQNHVRVGAAWNSNSPMSDMQKGSAVNYCMSDYDTLMHRRINYVVTHTQNELNLFKNAPILVARKSICDTVNNWKVIDFAGCLGVVLHIYKLRDIYRKEALPIIVQDKAWKICSSVMNKTLGCIPFCIEMPVMMTENLTLSHAVINGGCGIIKAITYSCDEQGN